MAHLLYDVVNIQDSRKHRVGSAERLTALAQEGHLPKHLLASVLNVENRQLFLDRCAGIEHTFTEACTANSDPCLESGCAVANEGEICLQALYNAQSEYQQACAAEWIELFRSPANRIEEWKH
jgi:hypothetical protein